MLKTIYNDSTYFFGICHLKDRLNDSKVDLTLLYQTTKKLFGSTPNLYPFHIDVEPSNYDSSKLVYYGVSFVDCFSDGTVLSEPIAVFFVACLPRSQCFNQKHIIQEAFHLVSPDKLLSEAKKYHEENSKISADFFSFQFENLDFAAEAASLLKEHENSCLFKEKNLYTLIFPAQSNEKDLSFLLPKIAEYSCSSPKSLTSVQFQRQLFSATDVVFEQNAVQKLNQYYAACCCCHGS